jgi:hypothetical protein
MKRASQSLAVALTVLAALRTVVRRERPAPVVERPAPVAVAHEPAPPAEGRGLSLLPELGWAAGGAYLYLFGWMYTNSFFRAWGVTPEDLGYNFTWIVIRTGIVLGVILAIAVGLSLVDVPAWYSVVLVSTIVAVPQIDVVDISLPVVVAFAPTIAVPAVWAARRLVGGGDQLIDRWWVAVLMALVSLFYIAVYAGRLGERFHDDSLIGTSAISFLPNRFLPHEAQEVVTIETRTVRAATTDGDDLGCGLLLGNSQGFYVVYDNETTYRFPVDAITLADSGDDCDVLRLRVPQRLRAG